MALSSRGAPVFYRDGGRKVAQAAERLDQLRAFAERLPAVRRREAEPALDRLRGLLNRARARLEGVRVVGDDADRVAYARADALTAVDDLLEELARLENRLPLAA